MTCRQVEQLIAPYAAGSAISPQAAAHIAECSHCSGLAELLARQDRSVSPSPEQLQHIKAKMLADLRPVKRLASSVVILLLFSLISIAAVAVGTFHLGTAGWLARNATQRTAEVALLAAGVVLVFSISREMVPGSRVLIPGGRFVIGTLCVLVILCAALYQVQKESTFVATGLVCLRIGMECAFTVSALSFFVLRRGVVLSAANAGALTGAFAGLSGLALLEIFCPNLNRYHILAWHLGAVALSIIAGTVAGFIAQRMSAGHRFRD